MYVCIHYVVLGSYETDRRTCWANARWKTGRPRCSVQRATEREGDTTGKTAGCENGEGRTRSGRKGSDLRKSGEDHFIGVGFDEESHGDVP